MPMMTSASDSAGHNRVLQGNIADLVIDVDGGNRGGLLASRQRADRACDVRERTDGPPHHEQRRK